MWLYQLHLIKYTFMVIMIHTQFIQGITSYFHGNYMYSLKYFQKYISLDHKQRQIKKLECTLGQKFILIIKANSTHLYLQGCTILMIRLVN